MSFKFTERSEKVFRYANCEATGRNHENIDTDDILIGIYLDRGGAGHYVLNSLGITLEKLREEAERLKPMGRAMVALGRLGQTTDCKRVIELSIEESGALGHSYVGTEHLLLALTKKKDCVAATILRNLGVGLEVIRREVLNMLGYGVETAATEANLASPIAQNTARILTDLLIEAGKSGQDLPFLLDALDRNTFFRRTIVFFLKESQFVERKPADNFCRIATGS